MKIPGSLFLLVVVLLFPFSGRTQNIGIGADVMYNFQSESFGAGARVSIFPNNRLSFVPQFSYYPGFNKVHEYYLGLALEYKFCRINQFVFYAIGHAGYDAWLNYESSGMKGAKKNNWDFEGGIGVTTNKCLRPFLEYRYNIKFRETHLRLGVLYIFGCKVGGGSGRSKGRKNSKLCPAYT